MIVALPSKILFEGLALVLRETIWAFYFKTSAGARMRHDTSSPVPEAREWATGRGSGVWARRDLVPS